jgi:hypothetical protein
MIFSNLEFFPKKTMHQKAIATIVASESIIHAHFKLYHSSGSERQIMKDKNFEMGKILGKNRLKSFFLKFFYNNLSLIEFHFYL